MDYFSLLAFLLFAPVFALDDVSYLILIFFGLHT